MKDNNNKKQNAGMERFIWLGILILSAVVLVVGGIQIFRLSNEYRKGIKTYYELEQYATVKEEPKDKPKKEESPTDQDTVEEVKESQIKVDLDIQFSQLKGINSDFIGWLYYAPLELSYPIVRGNDNEYYTHYTFENEKNSSGAIFMDFLNRKDFTDYNTIIYGHNMRNGTMFGSLKKLLNNSDMIEGDPYFYIFAEGKAYMYEIFAVYITSENSKTYELVANTDEQAEYLKYVDSKATYRSGKEVTPEDKVVTLSTCHGLHSTNRTIVHGVLIAEEDW